MPLIIQAA